jgi:hypothetical protein
MDFLLVLKLIYPGKDAKGRDVLISRFKVVLSQIIVKLIKIWIYSFKKMPDKLGFLILYPPEENKWCIQF